MTIRVLVVDDQDLLRTAFRVLIETEDDLEVVGEAADGAQAVALAATTRPDVIVMDSRTGRWTSCWRRSGWWPAAKGCWRRRSLAG